MLNKNIYDNNDVIKYLNDIYRIYQPDDEIHNRHSRRYAKYKLTHNKLK